MPQFRVVHYETPAGRDVIEVFLDNLPEADRDACDVVIDYLETGELESHPRNSAFIGDGIWELCIARGGRQFRFLYGTDGGTAYIVTAFIKKTPQAPKAQLDKARQRFAELKEEECGHEP